MGLVELVAQLLGLLPIYLIQTCWPELLTPVVIWSLFRLDTYLKQNGQRLFVGLRPQLTNMINVTGNREQLKHTYLIEGNGTMARPLNLTDLVW